MLYKFLRATLNVLFRFIYIIEVQNKEKIPKDGKLIVCANHINNLDPVIISLVMKQQIFWMAKKELFKSKPLSWLLVKIGAFPVDRENTSLSTMRHSMKILKNNSVLGVFPEGTRVKEIDLKNAKPGVALISIKSKAPILPIYLEATYRPFSKIKVVVGDIMEFYNEDVKNGKDDYKNYGEKVLKNIYNLKK